MKHRSLFWLFVWSGIGIAILLGLGTWQLFRLAEKRAYLAGLEERIKAPAIPIETAMQQQDPADFLKVALTGTFRDPSLYMQSTFDGGPGWRVLTPLTTPQNLVVLVDRGKIPASLRDDASLTLSGEQKVEGIVRHFGKGQGLFEPDNDAEAGNWYWWDVPAMLGALNLPPDQTAAGFVVQALPSDGAALIPRPDEVTTGVPNNHLGYALTWFSLAICLAAVSGLVARREIARHQA